MMKPLRCQLCGETYLGEEVTDRCPYCGAAGWQLVSAAEWIDFGHIEMTTKDLENCREALGLELGNTGFYKACVKKAENIFNEAIFKRLSKHELEHAEVLTKMMGVELPDPPQESCPDTDADKFTEAHAREHRAIKFYLQAAKEADNPRVAEVFRSLAEIETEHLQISNVYR